jgi:hypothetical protein
MNSKKWLKLFVIYSFVVFIFFLGINYIIDPLKLFHKPYFLKNKLNSNMRLQAAGIIKNYNFDSIILGTSMLENTSSEEASNIFDASFMNISLSGSDFFERSFVLNYALEKKKINNVIYSLDYSGLINYQMGREDYTVDNFDYLYDNSYINDFKQYMNLKSIKLILKGYLSKEANFDRPNEWFTNKSHSSRFGGIDNWFKSESNNQIKKALATIQKSIKAIENNKTIVDKDSKEKLVKSQEYLKKYLLKYVKNNSNTEFYLIIPPYSRIQNAINAKYRKSDFERLKKNIKFLVEKSNRFENLKIFGWGDKEFPNNISLYKDLTHYSPEINSKMLYWIRENNGLLTLNNIKEYLKEFEQKSLSYDLQEVGNKIEKHLHKK